MAYRTEDKISTPVNLEAGVRDSISRCDEKALSNFQCPNFCKIQLLEKYTSNKTKVAIGANNKRRSME